jgi:hypothetical protein
LADITAGINAVDTELLVHGERRNQLALAAVGVEAPAVITAFQLLAVELPAGEWHAPVGAGIVQGEGAAILVAAQYQGEFEQCGLVQTVTAKLSRGQSSIPEAVKHQGIGRLALRGFKFTHGDKAAYYRKAQD